VVDPPLDFVPCLDEEEGISLEHRAIVIEEYYANRSLSIYIQAFSIASDPFYPLI
jgi:hypothetical protein